ncbi:MAG TPA: hypothetical protein PLS28_06265 [Clostridiales bacterium]|nr:hypothetical protein [Clostridiales bacterium]
MKTARLFSRDGLFFSLFTGLFFICFAKRLLAEGGKRKKAEYNEKTERQEIADKKSPKKSFDKKTFL